MSKIETLDLGVSVNDERVNEHGQTEMPDPVAFAFGEVRWISALTARQIKKTMDYVKRNPIPRRQNRTGGRRSTD